MGVTNVDEVVNVTLQALKRNGFRAMYAPDVEAAREKVLQLIPKGTTVGVGDSVSVRQLKVLDTLQREGRLLVDPFSREIALRSTRKEITEDQRWAMHKIAVNCEVFITGSNALTQNGMLVNTDGGGNRVAGMIFGPKKVILVVGVNKIVADLEQALHRIKNVIAPELARIKGMKVPCVKVGHCIDCNSTERICNVTTILERAPAYTETTVLLVDQDLGLGWAKDWAQERKEQIESDCAALTWLRRRVGDDDAFFGDL